MTFDYLVSMCLIASHFDIKSTRYA